LKNIVRAKRKKHLPVAVSQQETQTVLGEMHGPLQLIATLLMEAVADRPRCAWLLHGPPLAWLIVGVV
jgi:hypothetical protein